MQAVLDQLDSLADKNKQYLVLIDEIQPCNSEGEADWSGLVSRDNVQYMLGILPASNSDTLHEVTPPADLLTLSTRLLTPHRSCDSIRRFNLFVIHHYGK